MFEHSCFIENSKEAREWLESIGYHQCHYKNDDRYIMTNHDIYTSSSEEYDKIYFVEFFGSRDCRSNLPLFKALTAVRDDSDYLQHFTNGIIWCKCHLNNFDHFAIIQKENPMMDMLINWHKATKEELIEKFKK